MNRARTLSKFAQALALVAIVAGPLHGQNDEVPKPGSRTSEEVRELKRELSELREWLQELEGETARAKKEIEDVTEMLLLQQRLEATDAQLEQEQQDSKRFERLTEKLVRLEHQFEARERVRNLRALEFDVEEKLERLREFPGDEVAKEVATRLHGLAKMIQDIRTVLNKLEKARQSGTRKEQERLAEQAWELEERIDQDLALVDLAGEYSWALEEEDEERMERMRGEIAESFKIDSSETPDRGEAFDPTHLPVPLTERSLKEFQNVDFDKEVVPLLSRYCFDCHGHHASSGDLNLESLVSQKPLVVNRDKWINVIQQARNRAMPPEDGALPTERERKTMVLSLHNGIHGFDYSQIRDPGFEVSRRLTHKEYDRTVGDLFGVEVNIAGRFPKELSGRSGFDNSGNTLFLQPLSMERYLSAADEIVEELLPEQAETKSQQKATSIVFFVRPESPSQETGVARAIIKRFVGRAFRRPLRADELKRLEDRYAELKSSGRGHEDALRAIVRQTLISPNFLMKFEETPSDMAEVRISDWELANRLSYFLWASMPDEELFRLAADNQLHQPKTLRRQVDRMLRDPRAMSLGEIFAAQWLGSQHLGTRVRLDPIDNPWCTDSLMKAMRDETAMFFHSLVTNNERIERLIDAKYSFLNAELAALYEIKGVYGQHMRRVDLANNQRGGILGHGSVLAVTSFPYRTSPVVRGKWVLETLLGTPPPRPPPNVSQLSDEILENGRLTIRQKLEHHRSSPSCIGCHSEMDPLGLSLEKYDWFGRYRERYDRGRINDRGTLPGGVGFVGLQGLKEVLIQARSQDLVRQVTSKMLSYALGRQLEYYDESTVREIIEAISRDENRLQPLIQHIVSSFPFQYKRNPVRTQALKEGQR